MAAYAEGDLRKLQQRAIEQLMEDESLRSDLTDSEAKVLLDWGAERLKRISTTVQAQNAGRMEEVVGGELKRLRGAMRAIAGLVGSGEPFTSQQLLEELGPYLPKPSGFKGLFAAFANRSAASQLIQERESLTNEELIRCLVSFVEKGELP
jgi:hypothetical protein